MVRSTAARWKVRFRGHWLALPCLILLAPLVEAQTFSGAGNGSLASPYVITDVTQLQQMNLDLSAHYLLANDIDASETEAWNGGMGFEPIGTFDTPFRGVFDGSNYAISGLFIERATSDHVGLFGVLREATVQNVFLADSNVKGKDMVGGLVGLCAFLNVIENCSVSGSVSGIVNIGGVAGWALETAIIGCRSKSSAYGAGYNVGGLVGYTSNQSQVIDSHADCDVSGPSHIGGLIGHNANVFFGDDSMAIRCSSEGAVQGASFGAGGIAGRNAEGSIINCYSSCSILGATAAGGLVGINIGHVENCYSFGMVSGENEIGGLIGLNDSGTSTSCYWDHETSGQPTSAGGLGKTTAEMFQMGAFEGWDFDAVWWIDEGNDYPRLLWELGDPKGLLRMIEDFRDGRRNGHSILNYSVNWKGNLNW